MSQALTLRCSSKFFLQAPRSKAMVQEANRRLIKAVSHFSHLSHLSYPSHCSHYAHPSHGSAKRKGPGLSPAPDLVRRRLPTLPLSQYHRRDEA